MCPSHYLSLCSQAKGKTRHTSWLALNITTCHVRLIYELVEVQDTRKRHAIVQFHPVHRGVVKVKAFQLHSQQVRELGEFEPLHNIEMTTLTMLLVTSTPYEHHTSSCICHRNTGCLHLMSQGLQTHPKLLPTVRDITN